MWRFMTFPIRKYDIEKQLLCFIFRYIWHLYLSMFLKKSDADKAKSLSDKFRIIQAFLTSVPLMLLNVITLINALKVEGYEVLDISYLSQHLGEGKNYTITQFENTSTNYF